MPVPQWSPPLPGVGATSVWAGGDRVWVWVAGGWHPGVVASASPVAALVYYRPAGGNGRGTDTVTCGYLAPRSEADQVDEAGRSPPAPRRPAAGC